LVLTDGDLADRASRGIGVDEDEGFVEFPPYAPAARLSATPPQVFEVSPQERLVVAEGANDLGELHGQVVKPLAIGAGIVSGRHGSLFLLGAVLMQRRDTVKKTV
jgi:hypothetical protein